MVTSELLTCAVIAWLLVDCLYLVWIIYRWPHPLIPPDVNKIFLHGLLWPVWFVTFLALCVWFVIACIIDLATGDWRQWFHKKG